MKLESYIIKICFNWLHASSVGCVYVALEMVSGDAFVYILLLMNIQWFTI